MTKFVRFLFAVSDAFAALVFGVAFLCVAVGFWALVSGFPRYDEDEITTMTLVISCVAWAVVACGAYMLLRRRVLGVVLVSALVLKALLAAEFILALTTAAFILAVFFLPFVIVLYQAHKSITPRESVRR